eukprot:365169-Chlamydomonas_euryale.AAC.12
MGPAAAGRLFRCSNVGARQQGGQWPRVWAAGCARPPSAHGPPTTHLHLQPEPGIPAVAVLPAAPHATSSREVIPDAANTAWLRLESGSPPSQKARQQSALSAALLLPGHLRTRCSGCSRTSPRQRAARRLHQGSCRGRQTATPCQKESRSWVWRVAPGRGHSTTDCRSRQRAPGCRLVKPADLASPTYLHTLAKKAAITANSAPADGLQRSESALSCSGGIRESGHKHVVLFGASPVQGRAAAGALACASRVVCVRRHVHRVYYFVHHGCLAHGLHRHVHGMCHAHGVCRHAHGVRSHVHGACRHAHGVCRHVHGAWHVHACMACGVSCAAHTAATVQTVTGRGQSGRQTPAGYTSKLLLRRCFDSRRSCNAGRMDGGTHGPASEARPSV